MRSVKSKVVWSEGLDTVITQCIVVRERKGVGCALGKSRGKGDQA